MQNIYESPSINVAFRGCVIIEVLSEILEHGEANEPLIQNQIIALRCGISCIKVITKDVISCSQD